MISCFMKAYTIKNLPLTVYVSVYAGGIAVVAQKCQKIGFFFIPGYPTNFGCHGNKESEIF